LAVSTRRERIARDAPESLRDKTDLRDPTRADVRGAEVTAPVNAGDVLAGKYRVERVLGMGGMGVVVAAKHMHLDQRVALKFLLPDLATNAETVARFAREARAAVKIQSEHVGRVIDVGTLDSGSPYMVMEYLEGSDLSDVLRSRGPLPWQEAIDYVLQACEAIAEAHVSGIVHRDLKPANLFLIRRADGSPCIKVLDFGISKALESDGRSGPALTQTSALMGSPKYMSPEQLKSSRDVDARTDIWALGIILYELLSGEGAFRADTAPQLYVSIIQDPPQPLRRPDLPPGLDAIIFRCLEKDPARRFQTVADLARALGDFAPPQSRVSIERVSRIMASRSDTSALPGGGVGLPPLPHSVQGPPVGAPLAQPHGVAPTLPGASYSQSGYPQGQGQGQGQHGHGHAQAQAQAHSYGAPAYPQHTPQQAMQYPMAHVPQGHPGGGYQGYPQGPHPQGHHPQQQQQQQQGMHPAMIVLLTIAVIFVLGMGGCMVCVCVGAASQ
jgi:serine/threonine-protein kinase